MDVGKPHTYVHACTHMYTCMHYEHDNFMQMAVPIGKSMGIPYDVICACTCLHAHMHVHGVALTHPSTHPPPWEDPLESVNIQ